jgi:hypothetical protein
MAHYAFIDSDNLVTQVIVGRDENDLGEGVTDWETYYGKVMGQVCRQTSYNTRGGVHYDPETGLPSEDQTKALRFNYAGIGFTYDPDKGTDGALFRLSLLSRGFWMRTLVYGLHRLRTPLMVLFMFGMKNYKNGQQ